MKSHKQPDSFTLPYLQKLANHYIKAWFTLRCCHQHSIASIMVKLKLTQLQLQHYLTSVIKCSTNQIV